MRVYIESKELTVLEILLLITMEARAHQLQGAVVEVYAPLHLVHYRVVQYLIFVAAQHVLLLGRSATGLVQQLGAGVVGEGVLQVRVAAHVLSVMVVAQVQFVFMLRIAWHCFEHAQELLHVFDKGLRECGLYLGLLVLFAAVPVHSAQSSNKKYYPYPI